MSHRKHRPRKGGMNTHAQMEILGLVIIVVLIMIGVLFAISFVFQDEGSDVGRSFRESQLASNMLNALLSTTTDCHGATMTQLLQDCAATASITCPSGNSCQHAQLITDEIFNKTLDTWKRNYHFTASGSASLQDLESGQDCPGERESKSRPLPIQGGGTIILRLDLCT